MHALLLSLAVAFPDEALLARVESGAIVESSTLDKKVVQYTFGARIDAPVERVSRAAGDMCNAAKRDPKATTRFLAAKDVEPFLNGTSTDISVFASLPEIDCKTASTMLHSYFFYEMAASFPIPRLQSLVRQDVTIRADGVVHARVSQILGGLGGKMDTDAYFVPINGGGSTAYVVRGEYGVPPMVPDFVVEQMMKVPESENVQRKQLAWLQKRTRQ